MATVRKHIERIYVRIGIASFPKERQCKRSDLFAYVVKNRPELLGISGSKPKPQIRILDLFCCGGGAAEGYRQGFSDAGFEVEITGIDIEPQPNYPFNFIQSDAIEYLDKYGQKYDFLHASPPCQSHTSLRHVHKRSYQCFIVPTRERFRKLGKPYVIENVVGAPLEFPITICGHSLGMPMHGHRLFECNPFVFAPPDSLCRSAAKAQKCGRSPIAGENVARPTGHFSGVDFYRKLWGCDWLNQHQLAQSIPPQFTKFIAIQMSSYLREIITIG